MDESHLFALVAYKNFHLADFENISRREQRPRPPLRAAPAHWCARPSQPRTPASARCSPSRHAAVPVSRSPHIWANASVRYADASCDVLPPSRRTPASLQGVPHVRFGRHFTPTLHRLRRSGPLWRRPKPSTSCGDADRRAARRDVAQDARRRLISPCSPRKLSTPTAGPSTTRTRSRAELADIERDIERLRRADFAELVAMPQFTLLHPRVNRARSWHCHAGFADVRAAPRADLEVAARLRPRPPRLHRPELLPVRGPVLRPLHRHRRRQLHGPARADQHHGHRLRPQPRGCRRQPPRRDGGRRRRAHHTVAAYNIDIVNHLLAVDHSGAADVVERLVTDHDDDARTFLAAYFTSGAHPTGLAARLAAYPWREAFVYLCTDHEVGEPNGPPW